MTRTNTESVPSTEWEERGAALWAAIDGYDPEDFRAAVDALAAELPEGHPVAAFERACANDSTGRGEQAVPLYEAALAAGLTGIRRRRAVIQMSSTLRALGHPEAAVRNLTAERENGGDELDDALDAFLALALTDVGREREAVALALVALADHLPRYNRSLAAYARLITPQAPPA